MLDTGNNVLECFWGKAQPGDEKDRMVPEYHPLVAHMLDVFFFYFFLEVGDL
mgnify:CR=1 FL=1